MGVGLGIGVADGAGVGVADGAGKAAGRRISIRAGSDADAVPTLSETHAARENSASAAKIRVAVL